MTEETTIIPSSVSLSDATPEDIATSDAGTSNLASRGDHAHDIATGYITSAMLEGAIASSKLANDIWEKIAEVDVASNSQSVTISTLTGNTDIEYMIVARWINNSGGGCQFYIRPNGDTTTANYQEEAVSSDAGGLARVNSWNIGIPCGNAGASGKDSYAVIHLSALVGGGMNRFANFVTGSDSANMMNGAGIWKNTADEITSLEFYGSSANSIGQYSKIILFRKSTVA